MTIKTEDVLNITGKRVFVEVATNTEVVCEVPDDFILSSRTVDSLSKLLKQEKEGSVQCTINLQQRSVKCKLLAKLEAGSKRTYDSVVKTLKPETASEQELVQLAKTLQDIDFDDLKPTCTLERKHGISSLVISKLLRINHNSVSASFEAENAPANLECVYDFWKQNVVISVPGCSKRKR